MIAHTSASVPIVDSANCATHAETTLDIALRGAVMTVHNTSCANERTHGVAAPNAPATAGSYDNATCTWHGRAMQRSPRRRRGRHEPASPRRLPLTSVCRRAW